MRKLICILFIMFPALLWAQSKSDWTIYGTAFCYENEKIVEKSLLTAGVIDLTFTPDGKMVTSWTDAPISFFSNGKDYSTGRVLFEKEGSKMSIMKGGETSNAVTVLIDSKNNLWFGTRKGLHKLDAAYVTDLEKLTAETLIHGTRFSDETPGLPFSNVTAIRQGKNGIIWVAGLREFGIGKVEYKGVSKFDGTQWTNIPVAGLEDKEIEHLILDEQGNPVVVSKNGSAHIISVFRDNAWKSLSPLPKNDPIVAVTCDKNNVLYAANPGGVFTWKNDSWQKVSSRKDLFLVNDIKFDKNNSLWVAADNGVTCLNAFGGEFELTSLNSPLTSNTVKKIVIDSGNKKWFVSSTGIIGFKEPQDYSNATMTIYTKYNSAYIDGKVESIANFKDGLLMVNNDRGLLGFDGKVFSLLTPSNQSEVMYNDVAVDKNGTAYMATYRYIHKLDGTSYTKWDWKDDIGKQVNTVMIDNQDKVWIGFDGVSKFDGAAWQNFNKKNAGLSSNSVLQLFQDSKNNIWAALSDGVAKYDGTTWTSFTKKTAGVGLRNMNGIAETKEGKILFSDGYSLIESDGTTMKEVPGFKQTGTLRNMIVMDDGTLLIATQENGIAKFKDGSLTFCNQATCGLPTNAINYIFKDTKGKLWVSCGKKEGPVAPMITPMSSQPAPAETPKQAFSRKLQEFDSFFGLIQLNKL